jgi:N-glycosylase/DNA lyase
MIDTMPHSEAELASGVTWGSCDVLFTPAFWKIQYHLSDFSEIKSHKIGESILEEIVACLLGGYGLPSEMGLEAFRRMKERQLIRKGTQLKAIHLALVEPFNIGNRSVQYRFYNQKSKFIAELLNRDDLDAIPMDDDLKLREWLLSLKGIGPKTASWITRNWFSSERVAILDIHLIRAGIIAGFFEKGSDVGRSYFDMEKKFLNFCKVLDVKPSNMDALIWRNMKGANRIALSLLNH